MKLFAAAAALVSIAACGGPVKNVRTRADYEAVDRTQTVRLGVSIDPLPEGRAELGQLWSAIAREYTNHHRDFIAKTSTACGEGIEGLLRLAPAVARVEEAVEASVVARIVRCRDGEEVWAAEAGGSWPSSDPQVSEVIRTYVEAYGEPVRPYVAPSFHLLRAVLDQLPRPSLPDDQAVMEKIELSED